MHGFDQTPPATDPARRRIIAIVAALVSAMLVVSLAPWIYERLAGPPLDARPVDVSDVPLGAAPQVEEAGSYRFLERRADGTPVRYDPCAPIHLEINRRTEIDDGGEILREAIVAVEEATGLRFVLDGDTDTSPTERERLRAGLSPSPVLVAWSDPREAPTLKGSVAGYAGSIPTPDGDWWLTGTVVLDGPALARIAAGPGGRAAARAIVMHELAHLVGLGHVKAPRELMQPVGEPGLTDWGPGDRARLAQLGPGDCRNY